MVPQSFAERGIGASKDAHLSRHKNIARSAICQNEISKSRNPNPWESPKLEA